MNLPPLGGSGSVWETFIIFVISVVLGLIFGISLSKFAELGLLNIIQGDINYNLSISLQSVSMSFIVFGIIFILLFLNSIRQIRFSSTINLIKSENMGEKPPKANYVLGILGIVILCCAYCIAVKIENPVLALSWFFIAVIMVIIGTYIVMISGSVMLCKFLQKRKNYYYKSNHFVSISSMIYRMKRNGASLGSICILATMVLVMISSTVSLYVGVEDAVLKQYPKEMNISVAENNGKFSVENIKKLENNIYSIGKKYNCNFLNKFSCRSSYILGKINGNTFKTDLQQVNEYTMTVLSIITVEDYNSLTGSNEILDKDEVILCKGNTSYEEDTISLSNGKNFKIKKYVDNFNNENFFDNDVLDKIYMFVNDIDYVTSDNEKMTESSEEGQYFTSEWVFNFDTGISGEKQLELYKDLKECIGNYSNDEEVKYYSIGCREDNRSVFYELYGSLLYLGIILSVIFIFATVLIIYYKQITEGYEDQSKFGIMKKIGMTDKEIRKSINSQILTVFFLPLILAGIHLLFAFPIIQKILIIFEFNNVNLFIITTLISFLIFALFYSIVYKITSKIYYDIVSKDEY